MNKDILLYNLRNKKHLIETELTKCQIQLRFLENHLKDIGFEIRFYWILLLLPPVLAGLLLTVSKYMRGRSAVFFVFTTVLAVIVISGWLLYSGFTVYHLLKSYCFKRLQAHSKSAMIAPPPVRNPIEVLNKPSKQTLYAGHKMTEWKIARYTYFLEQINQYLSVLSETSEEELREETVQEISQKTETFVLYADIEVDYDLPKQQMLFLNISFTTIMLIAFSICFRMFYQFILMFRR